LTRFLQFCAFFHLFHVLLSYQVLFLEAQFFHLFQILFLFSQNFFVQFIGITNFTFRQRAVLQLGLSIPYI
jgi:hypothetical protein